MASKHISASSIREIGRTVSEAHMKLLRLVLAGGPYSTEEIEAIDRSNGELTMASMQLNTNAVGVSMRGLGMTVTSLKDLARTARDAIEDINDVQEAVRLLSLVAAFSAAVAMGDVQGIVKSSAAIAKDVGKDIVWPGGNCVNRNATE